MPLQRDLARIQRRLRLRPEAGERELELDLRKETDAERGRLLHRLRLLGIGWGEPAAAPGGTGTFRETWRLRWEPELSVRVAEAGVWGTTVLAAATAKTEADAVGARGLAEVTGLAERCLLAALPEALPTVMRILTDRAALDTDVGRLARALPALVRSLRYGDVRGTDTAALAEVASGLAERVFVGLPPACAALDADAADEMRDHVDAVHGAVGLLGDDPAPGHGELRARWQSVLRTLSARDTVPGAVRGRSVRLLLDDGALARDEAGRLMGLALSPGTPPADAGRVDRGLRRRLGRRTAPGPRRAAARAGRRVADGRTGGGVHGRTAAAAADVLGVRGRGAAHPRRTGPARTGDTRRHGGRGPGRPRLRPPIPTPPARTPCCRSCGCCSGRPRRTRRHATGWWR
ncbi:hypothetical protein GCM10023238_19100 [Streptomyces heliomycini]